MRDLEIRDAVPSDRNAIVALDPDAQIEPARAEFVHESLLSAVCLVAEHGDRVVGYGVLEHTFFGNGFISMVYVTEPMRRQGAGRRLLQELAKRCATPKLFTSTNESNQPMQRLLEALGYVPSGVVENLDPGDPELFYFMDLGARS